MSLSYSNKFFLKPVAGSKRVKNFQCVIVNRQKAKLTLALNWRSVYGIQVLNDPKETLLSIRDFGAT